MEYTEKSKGGRTITCNKKEYKCFMCGDKPKFYGDFEKKLYCRDCIRRLPLFDEQMEYCKIDSVVFKNEESETN